MKIKFDANQIYQLQAIKSVVDIFEGQPLSSGEFEICFTEGSMNLTAFGVGNRLTISKEQILENVQKIQTENGLYPVTELQGMNFSIEMETGTGKTYVYLRTIYELNRTYGFKKFVIVVPSIAIREGVLKNLEITHEHFQNIYGNIPVSFDVYDSKKVSNLRGFALSNAIQILVLNIDSFAKDENIINRPNDRLTGNRPIEFIQSTNPIVIVDEPQNMETEIRKKAIDNLKPVCTLRYSATHIKLYNLVYSLDPVKAYDLGLVKQIEVDSVVAEDNFNNAFIAVEGFMKSKTKTAVKLKIDVNTGSGVVRKTVTVDNRNPDLFSLSNGREIYRDLKVYEIDVANETVELSNGTVLRKGESQGGLTDEIMKYQIQKTIEEHFKKEIALKNKGIKVLSLFFIDRVANYRQYDNAGNPLKGKFAEWFEELYKTISGKPAYKGKIVFNAGQVHNGYFASDKKGNFKDSNENRPSEDDGKVYHLIMQRKERLLDIAEPLRFIFSHSALREGWDNPNVFQICTLNETRSEMKKRQEIGRGLRLAVDQNGNRNYDRNVNRLTVVANEAYKDFAATLQNEIEQDCGVKFEGRIKNKRDRKKVEYRKGFQLDERFVEIWNRIKTQTTYRIRYDSEDLITETASSIKAMPAVHKPVIMATKTALAIHEHGIDGQIRSETKIEVDTATFEIPDILGYIQGKTELTRGTIRKILVNSGRFNDVLVNPQMFLDSVINEIHAVLHEFMIDGIKYEKIGNREYEMLLFEDHELEAYVDKWVFEIKNQEKTIHQDFIPLDSDVEIDFAKDCEAREDVEFYFKLPSWFTIKTPIGDYNPDWALIFKNEKRVYFVAETKGTTNLQDLRPEERMKIRCGYAHFKEFEPDGVVYKHVSSVSDLV
jgi:type III restriction enzyme